MTTTTTRSPLKTFALTAAQEVTIRAALGVYLDNRQRQIDDAMDAGDHNAAMFFQRHKDAAIDALRVMEEGSLLMSIHQNAVKFAVAILRKAQDWQEAQHALANHPVYGPWIEREAPDDEIVLCQAIIRQAEEILEAEEGRS